ncbi:MAG: protein translocase subunit SecF [Gammaproteobacteria bacterium]|nr:protein translocase subunit SecF [Gammaproteobacteria bacterium]
MEFFKTNTKIDFMRQRKWAALFSSILFIFSIVSLVVNGLNLGLDFTGGLQLQMHYKQPVNFSKVRNELNKVGFPEAVVQAYGTSQDIIVKLQPKAKASRSAIIKKVTASLVGAKLQQVDYIGPEIGKTLVANGLLAIFISLIATMAYIAIRFEYRFGISSTVALIHDPVLILGIFSFFHIEFNVIALAAVLTVIGFSLNDTVVVYDRVRENFRKLRKGTSVEVLNLSVNQTLSRTIMTSGLTLVVVVALFLFGGPTLRGFSLALIIGIVIGTYSSIYVAGSLAIIMGLSKQHLMPPEKGPVDDLP